jgi:hypothetical protein
MGADVRKGDSWVFNRDGGKMTLTGSYTVVYSNETYSTEEEAIRASYEGIVPDYGEACTVEGWEWLFVTKKTAKHLSPHNLTVEIIYTNIIGESSGNSTPQNPALAKPEVSFFTISNQEKIDKDKDDNAITNSANETPDPPLMEDDMWLGMRVIKYYSSNSYDPNGYAVYKRSVNSGTFKIKAKSGTYQFATGTVKFVEESMEEIEFGKDETYSKVTRIFHIRSDDLKWQRRLLDEGFTVKAGAVTNVKPGGTGNARRIVTEELTDPSKAWNDDKASENYNPYTYTATAEPTLLDGNGQLNFAGTPVFLTKETLTPVSYSGIV